MKFMTTTNQVFLDASMTNPTVGQKSLVVVGATGMVGGYALRYGLNNAPVNSVTSIGRKKLGISHQSSKRSCIPRSQMYSRLKMGGLLPRNLHRVGIGRGTPQNNRGLYRRVLTCSPR